ncbi:cytochrome-c peroxidase [Neisseria animalis]|uniref:Cytochrome-c peroxidase n=1 Tax=Neisseria animalis TaxID=492 RepID=A0A5P3MR92_NEIAN|nr:cytochrome-c peroxidase [Neisseria animalis]QEY24113.1 cytochrome-c peroxidase [Neisseria animalis]ROW32681.1 cytochrome-c peroxidase [Neisseria animalis]VEE06310.1 protein CcpR [Neisseria animalis]
MKRQLFRTAALSLAVLTVLSACGEQVADKAADMPSANAVEASAVQTADNSGASAEDLDLLQRAQGVFKPLPSAEEMQKIRPFSAEQIKLGQQLWYEPRLSKGNTVSCNSCHNLASAGVDNMPTSQGHKGAFGGRNSPTVLNAATLDMQFWDGRAADVEEQAGGPLLNPVEMANESKEAVVAKIANIPEYQAAFKAAFPDDGLVSFENITTAIGAFERTLLTPSKWDEYLKGNIGALTEKERKGVRSFMDNGCIACHTGINLGGSSFQKFGLVQGPYWKFIEAPNKDKGRADVTGNKADEFFFRVPGLRNVAKTYPYFHNGSVWELDKVVKIMGQAQLGKDLPQEEVDNIVAFLNTLSGSVPESARTMPELPLSSPLESHPDNK